MRLTGILSTLLLASAEGYNLRKLEGDRKRGRGPASISSRGPSDSPEVPIRNGKNTTSKQIVFGTTASLPPTTSYQIDPGNNKNPEKDTDLNAKTSAGIDIPDMEAEPVKSETGDTQDTPNVEGGPDLDLPPPEDGVDNPSMEAEPIKSESFAFPGGSGNMGDAQDTPNVDGEPSLDVPPPEEGVDIPSMEAEPSKSEQAGFPSITGVTQDIPNVDGDPALDLPPPEDGFTSISPPPGDAVDNPNTDGGPEIPSMEPIPEAISGSVGGRVGLPHDLPSGLDGFQGSESNGGDKVDAPRVHGRPDTPTMESTSGAGKNGKNNVPKVLPFGEVAENYILESTASVCASSMFAAKQICSNLPVCKFKKKGKKISTQLALDQGACVRRCDAPLGENHCAAHEECFHFVLGCSCPHLTNDGGECQPY